MTADLRVLGNLFEFSGDAMMIADAGRHVVAINPAFTKITGYEPGEILGRDASLVAADCPEERAIRLEALGRDGFWRGEAVGRRKDGALFPGWLALAEITDAAGNMTHRISVFSDITERKQTQRSFAVDEAFLRTLADKLPAAIAYSDRNEIFRFVNSAFEDWMRKPKSEILGHSRDQVVPASVADRKPVSYMTSATETHLESLFTFPDGVTRWTDIARVPDIDDLGHVRGYFRLGIDITERKATEEKLRLFANIFEQSGEAVTVCNADNRVMFVNPAFTRLTGYAMEEVMGRDPAFLIDDGIGFERKEEIWAKLSTDGYWQGEGMCRRKDGSLFPRWVTLNAIFDAEGRVTHRFSTFADITDRKEIEAQINRLAHHDALTGLPNRLNLLGRLEQTLASARRTGDKFAVVFLDLDRFKIINDTLGHHVGDLLLREVAFRLNDSVRESDVVARLGGDEFVVMLTGNLTAETAGRQADKILGVVGAPYLIEGNELSTTPSIGIAMFPEDGNTIDELMKNADAAMYSAKAGGRNNYQFFAASMNAAATERLLMEQSMRQGLGRREFILHYQPQIDIKANRVIGFEALVRWNHPTEGLIAPGRFIPVAEDTGLIMGLGEYVLREALRELKGWIDEFGPDIRMAINLSARQLRDREFPALVAHALAEAGVDPARVELEITESVAMANPEETIKVLNQLRAMGVQLAVDDFGTGYSSLAYLKHLPIQRLKVDQSFVRDIETDPNDAAICTATIALAHSIGLEVIAEGVETEPQLAYLKRLGTDGVQGYLFSKPLPPAEARAFLAGWGALVGV